MAGVPTRYKPLVTLVTGVERDTVTSLKKAK